ncbi:Phosphoribosylglycinamide synthetase, ATP-grasp [Sesbania bispinosa]|nr:Phosphoribosylglycinamide synthetase, ATP-grasp [Sesbania bispinosa]
MLAAYSIIAETPSAATITTTTFSSGSVAAPSSALLSATERPPSLVFIPHKDLFFVTDNCKGCTTKLEWKSSPDPFIFGSFELADSSSFCNLKTEEVMDEICYSIDQRRQDQSLSEKKEEEQNLDGKEETRIQHLHLIVSEGITASFEEQSATALLRYLFDIKFERNVQHLFDEMPVRDIMSWSSTITAYFSVACLYNAGLNFTKDDLVTLLTMNDKGDALNASYYHVVNHLTNTTVGAELTHKFSTNENTDTGPNAGGMGAYSPAPILTKELQSIVMNSIIMPTVKGMTKEGCKFVGVLYAGLMIEKKFGLPKLIEYNVRFGDLESQALMFWLESDLAQVLLAACKGELSGVSLNWSPGSAMVMVPPEVHDAFIAAVDKGNIRTMPNRDVKATNMLLDDYCVAVVVLLILIPLISPNSSK